MKKYQIVRIAVLFAAVLLLAAECDPKVKPKVSGKVQVYDSTYKPAGDPLANVKLTVGPFSTTTDVNGHYELELEPGTYEIKADFSSVTYSYEVFYPENSQFRVDGGDWQTVASYTSTGGLNITLTSGTFTAVNGGVMTVDVNLSGY